MVIITLPEKIAEKIAKGAKKIYFTMLYGIYFYIFIENFPQKFSPCKGSLVQLNTKLKRYELEG